MNVTHEIELLVEEIQRLGTPDEADGGKIKVKFGTLFKDDKVANLCMLGDELICTDCTVEALVGTLKAAKKRKVITFAGEILLQGAHDNVDVVLLTTTVPS